jgi:hypothetical protein
VSKSGNYNTNAERRKDKLFSCDKNDYKTVVKAGRVLKIPTVILKNI